MWNFFIGVQKLKILESPNMIYKCKTIYDIDNHIDRFIILYDFDIIIIYSK